MSTVARDPMTPPAGCVGITAEHRAEIEQQLSGLWDVLRVEHTWFRLTFYVQQNPLAGSRKILDKEAELSRKYGESPYIFATDFTTYRLTFIANR